MSFTSLQKGIQKIRELSSDCPIAVSGVSGVSGVSDLKLDMATHGPVRNVSGPVRKVSGLVRNVSGDAVRSCPERVSGMSGNVR